MHYAFLFGLYKLQMWTVIRKFCNAIGPAIKFHTCNNVAKYRIQRRIPERTPSRIWFKILINNKDRIKQHGYPSIHAFGSCP